MENKEESNESLPQCPDQLGSNSLESRSNLVGDYLAVYSTNEAMP
jgi:hypothetical protein